MPVVEVETPGLSLNNFAPRAEVVGRPPLTAPGYTSAAFRAEPDDPVVRV